MVCLAPHFPEGRAGSYTPRSKVLHTAWKEASLLALSLSEAGGQSALDAPESPLLLFETLAPVVRPAEA